MALPAISSNSVSELETISKTLASVIRKSFGPGGQLTLLSSSTGLVSLSSDGLTILSSLHLSHPAARSIVKELLSFIAHHGDGSKSIILYLSSFFHALGKEVEDNTLMMDNGTFIKGYISRCLLTFLSEDLPCIFNEIRDKIANEMKEQLGLLEINGILTRVLKSVLHGSLPNYNITHLTKAVTDFLIKGSTTMNDIRNSLQWFDHSVFHIPNQFYSASHAKNGIFLPAILHYSKHSLKDVTFICMQSPIDGAVVSDDNDNDILHLNEPDVLVSHKYSIVNHFLSSIKEMDISLIISSVKVSDMCLQLCQASNVAVIDCVDEADLYWLCDIRKKSPVTSVHDVIGLENVLKAVSCEKVLIAQKSFINVVLDGNLCQPKTLFLAGPSEGICQQLKVMVKRSIKVVSHLLDNIDIDGTEPFKFQSSSPLCSNVIPGFGYFEVLLCQLLHSYKGDKMISPGTKISCCLIQSMLMEVPRALYGDNFFLDDNAPCNFHNMDYRIPSVDMYRSGGPPRLIHDDVLEVLSIKMESVCTAVSLVISLLRVDGIIGVKSQPLEALEYELDMD